MPIALRRFAKAYGYGIGAGVVAAIAATVIAGSVGTGPAHADASTDYEAHEVCVSLTSLSAQRLRVSKGLMLASAVDAVEEDLSMSQQDAEAFVAKAIHDHCPQMSSLLRGDPNGPIGS